MSLRHPVDVTWLEVDELDVGTIVTVYSKLKSQRYSHLIWVASWKFSTESDMVTSYSNLSRYKVLWS